MLYRHCTVTPNGRVHEDSLLGTTSYLLPAKTKRSTVITDMLYTFEGLCKEFNQINKVTMAHLIHVHYLPNLVRVHEVSKTQLIVAIMKMSSCRRWTKLINTFTAVALLSNREPDLERCKRISGSNLTSPIPRYHRPSGAAPGLYIVKKQYAQDLHLEARELQCCNILLHQSGMGEPDQESWNADYLCNLTPSPGPRQSNCLNLNETPITCILCLPCYAERSSLGKNMLRVARMLSFQRRRRQLYFCNTRVVLLESWACTLKHISENEWFSVTS